MSVKTELDRANPNNLPDLCRLAKIGSGVALIARTVNLTVTANVATLPDDAKAMAILNAYATAPAGVNHLTPVASETTPVAGEVAVDVLGNVVFAAADAVTAVRLTYIPVEGTQFTETIQVATATNLGTFLSGRACTQIVSATLIAPAATPGAKTVVARGTLPAAVGAGNCAVQADGLTIGFLPAEVTADCTADVVYFAEPGIGEGVDDPFGDRLDADFDLG